MSISAISHRSEFMNHERNQQSTWQTVVEVYHEFSSQSTVHGIKYTSQAKTTFGRTMPFGISVKDFEDSLRYMSIAIFPSNRFEKQLVILDRVLTVNNLSLEDLFKFVTPSCSDYLVLCQFEGIAEDCENLLSPSVTPYGVCCSFNYAHLPNEHRWNTSTYEKRSVTFGSRFILSVLLKSFAPEDRISSMMFGDGVKVMIHERNTYPGPTALEFVAASGHETAARLYGRHLSASPEVMTLPPRSRDCKKSKSADRPYRADNCYVKCREKAFLRLCGCLPFFSSEIEVGQTICNITHVSCLARVKQKAYSLTLRDPLCNCLPDCHSTTFSLVTTTVPFTAPKFNPSKFYLKASTFANATAIHVTYSEQSAMLQRRELVLSWINLVSSLGGVFSLFLGCSFISIIEIIYFTLIFLILRMRNWRLSRRARIGYA